MQDRVLLYPATLLASWVPEERLASVRLLEHLRGPRPIPWTLWTCHPESREAVVPNGPTDTQSRGHLGVFGSECPSHPVTPRAPEGLAINTRQNQ